MLPEPVGHPWGDRQAFDRGVSLQPFLDSESPVELPRWGLSLGDVSRGSPTRQWEVSFPLLNPTASAIECRQSIGTPGQQLPVPQLRRCSPSPHNFRCSLPTSSPIDPVLAGPTPNHWRLDPTNLPTGQVHPNWKWEPEAPTERNRS